LDQIRSESAAAKLIFSSLLLQLSCSTSISGVSSEEAFATKVSAELDGIPVFVLARDALIRNKRALGRPQDRADLDVLDS
jgi:hypothetical protein